MTYDIIEMILQVRGDTSMIKRNNRTIDLQYTGNVKNLPEDLQEKINDFYHLL